MRIENAVHRRQLQKTKKPAPPPKESTEPPKMKPIGNLSPNGSPPPSISARSDSSAPRISPESSPSKKHHVAIIAGAIGGTLVILISILSIYICKTNKASVKPWATGLSGQLQKAFVTGKSFFLVK